MMHFARVVVVLVPALVAGIGCGSDDSAGQNPTGAGQALRCSDAPPAGAAAPAQPKPYSGGSCPALVPGVNTFTSTAPRQFILVVPANLAPTDEVPVIFLWHWLGADANDFLERGEVQKAVDAQRFIAVIPEAKEGTLFRWPFSVADTQQALDEELMFFDDMLSCVSEQFAVNDNCVATAGVSAGALFSGQLASYRGEYLSSFLSLSGGTGGDFIKPWSAPAHKLPAVVLWGGPDDTCVVINFQETSHDLEQNLAAGGHFFLECVHNCTHNEPPMEVGASSKYEALWEFVFDHPFWLKAGESPYLKSGIPAGLPQWCGVGAASAVMREGACGPSACSL
jgi:predicted esterase